MVDDTVHNEVMRRIQSSFGATQSSSQSSISKQRFPFRNPLDINQIHERQNIGSERRLGFPPSHPNIIPPLSPCSYPCMASKETRSPSFGTRPYHSRSLSQPPFFSLDGLISPASSPCRDSSSTSAMDASIGERIQAKSPSPSSQISIDNPMGGEEHFMPRKAHRRSSSDVPFGVSNTHQSFLSPFVLTDFTGFDNSMMNESSKVKLENEHGINAIGSNMKKSEFDVMDDMLLAYTNFENVDTLLTTEEERKRATFGIDDIDNNGGGSKNNGGEGSDNDVESSTNESVACSSKAGLNYSEEKKEVISRALSGKVIPNSRHYRSVSMDSFMGNFSFTNDSQKPLPSVDAISAPLSGTLSSCGAIDGGAFSLELGNGEFSGTELKKIIASEKLVEIALSDPKRAKRILANRQSAARSKERKLRYISELEHKVQTLQSEATTLSAQLTVLQRDSVGLANQNNELKFKIQAMEQQAHLRDALNEALSTEVRRLKLATMELNVNSDPLPDDNAHHFFKPQFNDCVAMEANQN